MAEYEPLKGGQSMTTSTVESILSNNSLNNCEEFVDDDDFSTFKSYSQLEFDNHVVTFTENQLLYNLDGKITAYFYSLLSAYDMKPDDKVGIVPMRRTVPFISKLVSQCEEHSLTPGMINDEVMEGEEKFIAKKACFEFTELPSEVAKEYYFQFCYLNNKNVVIGVSTPFRFKKNESLQGNSSMTASISKLTTTIEHQPETINNYDSIIMEKRDDDDFIVVRSQESYLKERIEHLTKSNTLLEYLIRTLEKDLAEKTTERQNLLDSLDTEKKERAKCNQEKNEIIHEKDLIIKECSELRESIKELKQLIDDNKLAKELLQTKLDSSESKLYQLSNSFQIEEGEFKKILNDKEEEIWCLKDMNTNLDSINKDLTHKNSLLEGTVLQLQSTLANAFNDRRSLLEEKEKNYETIRYDNEQLKKRVLELESVKEKQANEIKALEEELRTSVDNFNNLNMKFQTERNENELKLQKNALALDKSKYEYIELQARFEQARVEFADLYRKYKTAKRINRPEELAKNVSVALNQIGKSAKERKIDCNIDEIDLKLQQLEKEENEKEKLEVRSDILIDINSDSSTSSEVENETQTSVKTVESAAAVVAAAIAATNKPTKSSKTVVKMPCTMCEMVIECRQHEDGSGMMHEMVQHLEEVHKQKMCPICSTLFDTRMPIFATYFQNHVQNHFSNISYPNLNRK